MTDETKTTAVAPVETNQSAAPAFLSKYKNENQQFDQEDIEIPRIKLLQGLSPEVITGGHRPGIFFHTIAEEELGSSVEIVVLSHFKRVLLWDPKGGTGNGDIIARALDGVHWAPARGEFEVTLKGGKKVKWHLAPTVKESGLDAWGSSDPDNPNSPPAATPMQCYLIVLPSRPDLGPCLLTMQKSSQAVAKKLNSKLAMSDVPFFARRFIMKVMKDQNKDGQQFNNFEFTMNGYVESEEQVLQYQSLAEKLKPAKIIIKDERGDEDDSGEDDFKGKKDF